MAEVTESEAEKLTTLNKDSALEAFAHCCSETQLRDYLKSLSKSDRRRLRTHGHLALPLAMRFNKEPAGVLGVLLDQREIQVNLAHIGQDGNTILHVAVSLQDTEAVRVLLARREDLDPNVRNRRGEAPLHVAVKGTSCPNSLEVLDRLLADPRLHVAAVTRDERTALHVACMSENRGCKDPQVDVVRKLLASAPTKVKSLLQFLESVDDLGRTALHYSAESGLHETADEILDLLREHSCNVSSNHHALRSVLAAKDIKGCLAVHLAAQRGHLNIVTSLLECGECGDLQQEGSLALLTHAVRSGSEEIVRECLRRRGQLLLVDHLNLLSNTTHLNIAKLLLAEVYKSHVANGPAKHPTLLHWAVKLDCGQGTLNHSDGEGRALFIPHILKWHPEKANKFLDPAKRQAPLHVATISKNESAVRALCSESAPWALRGNKRDVRGYTALDYAFDMNNKPIQRILKARQDVKEYLAQLHTNRQTYSKASNAVLVVAALIATLTYTKCFTAAEVEKLAGGASAPSPSPPTVGTDYLEYATMPTRLAFVLAVTATLLAAFAALPFSFGLFFVQTTDDNYVRRSMYRTRVLIVVASYCLVLSIGAVMFGFICSQYISPFVSYRCSFACKVALVVFVCLSVVFLSTNAVSAVVPNWKKPWLGSRHLVHSLHGWRCQPTKSLSAKRAAQALDKKQSKRLISGAIPAGDEDV